MKGVAWIFFVLGLIALGFVAVFESHWNWIRIRIGLFCLVVGMAGLLL